MTEKISLPATMWISIVLTTHADNLENVSIIMHINRNG